MGIVKRSKRAESMNYTDRKDSLHIFNKMMDSEGSNPAASTPSEAKFKDIKPIVLINNFDLIP